MLHILLTLYRNIFLMKPLFRTFLPTSIWHIIHIQGFVVFLLFLSGYTYKSASWCISLLKFLRLGKSQLLVHHNVKSANVKVSKCQTTKWKMFKVTIIVVISLTHWHLSAWHLYTYYQATLDKFRSTSSILVFVSCALAKVVCFCYIYARIKNTILIV